MIILYTAYDDRSWSREFPYSLYIAVRPTYIMKKVGPEPSPTAYHGFYTL
jgi:hypothetical protein